MHAPRLVPRIVAHPSHLLGEDEPISQRDCALLVTDADAAKLEAVIEAAKVFAKVVWANCDGHSIECCVSEKSECICSTDTLYAACIEFDTAYGAALPATRASDEGK